MKAEVIIPTCGRPDMVTRCMSSLLEHTSSYRLTWIDNGSTPVDRQQMQAEFLKHTFRGCLWSSERLGFVGAVNLGLQLVFDVWHSQAPYVVLLNSDVEVMPGWLDSMISVLERDDSIWAVGPVTSECKSWQSYQNVAKVTGTFAIPSGFAALDGHGRAEKLSYVFGELYRPCRMVAFFCTVFRRKAFEDVGRLDPDFNAGFGDDDDYCFRMGKNGGKCALALGSYVHHEHRATFKSLHDDAEIKRMQEHAKATFIAKHGEEPRV